MAKRILPLIPKSQLIRDLSDLGLKAGDVVMLHASVKAIGWIVGGPNVILQAILDILTPTGTLMMLAGWEDNPYDLERWPKARQQVYLEECPAYEPATSRADRKNLGILAEYLRTWPGTIRSDHPFSYVAVGAYARQITESHPLQYSKGPKSPLAKLCELHGRILLLGKLFGCVTVLHHAEHLANVPDKRIDRYKMPVLQNGKRQWVYIEEYNTTLGIVDWDGNYFENIIQDYMRCSKGHSGTVGAAPSYLFDASELVQFAVNWMEQSFTNCPA